MRAAMVGLWALILLANPVAGQTEKERRAQTAALVETRLRDSLSVELSADKITLTGNVLHLKGHAKLAFDDTWIVAEEATVNHATKQVVLTGNVNAHLGHAVAPKSLPRIEYR